MLLAVQFKALQLFRVEVDRLQGGRPRAERVAIVLGRNRPIVGEIRWSRGPPELLVEPEQLEQQLQPLRRARRRLLVIPRG